MKLGRIAEYPPKRRNLKIRRAPAVALETYLIGIKGGKFKIYWATKDAVEGLSPSNRKREQRGK